MIGQLLFALKNDWDVTINEELKRLSVFSFWDKGSKAYFYVFPFESLEKVSGLVSPLKFSPVDFVKLGCYVKNESEEVFIDSWKGKSGFEVVEFPNFYRVISYQKPVKGGKPKKVEHDVPNERVRQLWEKVFLPLKSEQFYDYSYLALKTCIFFDLKRYFRDESGSWDGAKFQGQRTSGDYGKFYYFPCKVLEAYGLISRKGRFLARIKNEWTKDATLKIGVFEEEKGFYEGVNSFE